jgi:hypothetical protein
MMTRKGSKRGAGAKQRLLRMMIDYGPISARGVVMLTDGKIKGGTASKTLRDGVKLGVFEELPGAPSVYRPTRRALDELVSGLSRLPPIDQTTAQE